MSGEALSIAAAHRMTTESADAGTLFEELRRPLIRYLSGLGLAADEAQDVVQETFLRLQRRMRVEGVPESARSWLFRVAHNEAVNRRRSYERRFGMPLNGPAEMIADRSTPERRAMERERARRLAAAIRALSPRERECLLLRAEGLRYREIAEVLDIAKSTVAETVDRAVRSLAEKINV
jgi:RNA polymerase sigma-70 factor, ECF subfamily